MGALTMPTHTSGVVRVSKKLYDVTCRVDGYLLTKSVRVVNTS